MSIPAVVFINITWLSEWAEKNKVSVSMSREKKVAVTLWHRKHTHTRTHAHTHARTHTHTHTHYIISLLIQIFITSCPCISLCSTWFFFLLTPTTVCWLFSDTASCACWPSTPRSRSWTCSPVPSTPRPWWNDCGRWWSQSSSWVDLCFLSFAFTCHWLGKMMKSVLRLGWSLFSLLCFHLPLTGEDDEVSPSAGLIFVFSPLLSLATDWGRWWRQSFSWVDLCFLSFAFTRYCTDWPALI